ncbi:MAG: mechanosensitive ion channel [Planctomycetes bacterium]|nr:mechanosensitive ion channel [Planctomycetota bacterium]
MDPMFDWLSMALARYGLQVAGAILTLVIGWLVAKLVARGLRRVLSGARVDQTLAFFCVRLAYVAMMILVVIATLDKQGFPAVSFAAVVGAAGLAIGLALKNTLSNFAAGVILIALRPFNVGDRVDAAGVSGVVSEIRVFATTLAAEDGKTIIVPNAAIVGGNISKYSTT